MHQFAGGTYDVAKTFAAICIIQKKYDTIHFICTAHKMTLAQKFAPQLHKKLTRFTSVAQQICSVK